MDENSRQQKERSCFLLFGPNAVRAGNEFSVLFIYFKFFCVIFNFIWCLCTVLIFNEVIYFSTSSENPLYQTAAKEHHERDVRDRRATTPHLHASDIATWCVRRLYSSNVIFLWHGNSVFPSVDFIGEAEGCIDRRRQRKLTNLCLINYFHPNTLTLSERRHLSFFRWHRGL